MKFILSIDTEGDNQWAHGRPLTVENIKYVPRFQALCDKYNIKPTYLVTSEICDDPYSREVFNDYLKNDKAEVGAHLHAWTTPPFRDQEGLRFNDKHHPFASELPDDLLSLKIKNLTRQIEDAFNVRPTSFRSGRYGFNDNVGRNLVENSYIADSSVAPYNTWAGTKGLPGGSGGSDFISRTPFPFKLDYENGSLVEIPLTILPTRCPLKVNSIFVNFYLRNVRNSFPLRVLKRLILSHQPLWLRPHHWMNMELLGELLDESIMINLPYIVMIFHSSELMPGCSPYRPDANSIEKLYDLLEAFFISLQNKKIESIRLTEAGKVLSYENMFLG